MRAVAMRVLSASVEVGGTRVAEIGRGQLSLVGFGSRDSQRDIDHMIRRLRALRIFQDREGRMSGSADGLGLRHLLVPQFTLYGDVRRGNRPDFGPAMPPDAARVNWDAFCRLFGPAELGVFGADMLVRSENDGPVTILIDTDVQGGEHVE